MKPLLKYQLATAVEQEVTHRGVNGLGEVHRNVCTGVLEKLTRKQILLGLKHAAAGMQ